MRKLKIFCVFVILFSSQSVSVAQRHFPNLDRVSEAVEDRIKKEKPEWSPKSVKPVSVDETANTDAVKIQRWVFGRQSVKVAIVQHKSEEEAISALRQFAVAQKSNNQVRGLGDEAYVWGLRNAIAFRKGNLTIYVSAVVLKNINPAEGINTMKEAAQAEHAEAGKLTRGFAQHAAAALASL